MNQNRVLELLYAEFVEQNNLQEDKYRWDSIERDNTYFHLKRGQENMSVDGLRLLSRLSEGSELADVVSESIQVLNETMKYSDDDFSFSNMEENKDLYHVVLRKKSDVFYKFEDKETTLSNRETPFFGLCMVSVLDSENAFAFVSREHVSGEEEERAIFEVALKNMNKKKRLLEDFVESPIENNGVYYPTYVLEDDSGFAATQALFFDYDSLSSRFKRVGVAMPRRDLLILFDATWKKSILRKIQQAVRREFVSRYSVSDSLFERQEDGSFTKILIS